MRGYPPPFCSELTSPILGNETRNVVQGGLLRAMTNPAAERCQRQSDSCHGFDLQLSIAPFGMFGEIRNVIENLLQRRVDEKLCGADDSSHGLLFVAGIMRSKISLVIFQS